MPTSESVSAETGASGGPITTRNGLGAERVTEIQRARIVAAMTEVACERGAGNVTIAHVVERAGVSRRTFYELFDDRDGCYAAAFEESLRRATEHVLPAYRAEARWTERIRASLIALLELLDADPVMGLLLVGLPGEGTKTLERRRQVLNQTIAAIEQGRQQSKAGIEPPPLAAEGVVGGVLAILHARLSQQNQSSLLELTGPLMSMIVLPYLGSAAARRELTRPAPKRRTTAPNANGNPLRELQMRLTYRTIRVLHAVAARPGGSNRQVADAAEITDQGQISKLLARLQGLGLIENTGAGSARGAPNAWTLTAKGWEVETAITRNVPVVEGELRAAGGM
jgi:AcrR family transcriptional regulator/DNA-binding MarR family transcriptional regulator